MATAARFSTGAGWISGKRAKPAHRAAIFRLVAWSNDIFIPLDYNTPVIDEMRRLPKIMISSVCLGMISGQTLRVCPEGKPVSTFPDHALDIAGIRMTDVTDKAIEKLKTSGWAVVETTGFLHLIGPLWQRVVDGEHEYALVAQDKHHNRRGLVQGGVLMTFADRTCGMTARYVSGRPTLATVQMDTHFVEAGKIGETLLSKPRVVRSTQSLIFMSTEVTVDKRCIAMANGVFKILKNE
jgi:acyl-coenzyme A thioesterase PaaI-like protein